MKRSFDSRSDVALEALRRDLLAVADTEKVAQMEAYQRDQFPFLGVASKERRAAQRSLLNEIGEAGGHAGGDEVLAFATACWERAEREFQYVGMDALRKRAKLLGPEHLDGVAALITTKSWWDTVDSLATHTVGPMVAAHPDLGATMDVWIDDDNIWLARTAILHQLFYKEATDAERLFEYADRRAADTEFFIRKALGWALRQYARTDPEAVRAYVGANEDRLSGLTKREALKHLR